MTDTDISYLIPYVRLRIGDMDSTAYRYVDNWITTALIMSVKFLYRWWNGKYFITSDGIISRNPYRYFLTSDVNTVAEGDETVIVLSAAIIMLEGSLENSAWNLQSWRDSEISYTNLESGRIKDANLNRLREELASLITSPNKKLVTPIKSSLPGYLNNTYERDGDY